MVRCVVLCCVDIVVYPYMSDLEFNGDASKSFQEGEDEIPQSHFLNPWQSYTNFVQTPQNRAMVELLDELVSRLLWWFPHNTSKGGQWRQIVWGLLELQRLGLDLATSHNHLNTEAASTGNTVAIPEDIWSGRIRIALTTIQCLSPIAQGIVQDEGANRDHIVRKQARFRYRIEQLRFLLRITLLIRYWRKLPKDVIGLQQVGGMFHSPLALTLEQEEARLDRRNYIGTRTGRTVHKPAEDSISEKRQSHPSWSRCRMILGELLYILRPVFLAKAEAGGIHGSGGEGSSKLWQAWWTSLGMDVTSLLALNLEGNIATRQEWQRRRMRLLLYLLRTPVWKERTSAAVDRLDGALNRVPLLGGLMSAYLQDWLYYWMVYRAEEG